MYAELIAIQHDLKVPKAKFNSYGGFYYRSAEDILEAVKPLLAKHKLLLTMTDSVVLQGEEVYHDVQCVLREANDNSPVIVVSASAREAKERKGMDAAQLSGSALSYAKKYALGCLFLIDDGQDPDAYSHQPEQQAPQRETRRQPTREETRQDLQKQMDDTFGFKDREPGSDDDFAPVPGAKPLSSEPDTSNQRAYRKKVDRPNKQEALMMRALYDHFVKAGNGAPVDKWKLADAVLANFSMWPSTPEHVAKIKMYVALEDVVAE